MSSSNQTASIVRNLPKELWKWTNRDICRKAKLPSTFGGWQPVDGAMGKYVVEAKRRGLNCGAGDIASAAKAPSIPNSKDRDIEVLCSLATKERNGKVVWGLSVAHVKEAKRRGLSCGVGESISTQAASANSSGLQACPKGSSAHRDYCFGLYTWSNGTSYRGEWKNNQMHGKGTFIIPNESSYTGEFRNGKAHGTGARTWHDDRKYTGEFNNGKLEGNGTYTFKNGNKYEGEFKDNSFDGQGTFTFSNGGKDTGEWKDNKLNGYAVSYLADGTIDKEGIWKDDEFQYAKKLKPAGTTSATASSTNNQANTPISTALNAAQQKAEFERQKRIQLEKELAALKAEKEQQQATISADSQIPLIEVANQQKDEATALVYGRAKDNVGVADVLVNNEPVQIGSDGSFQTQLYIPPNGVVVEITAYDLKGNKATKTLSLNRSEAKDTAETRFAQLQPSLGKRGTINRNAIALIVGVEKYENLPAAPAIHADKDAEYFADFAHYKLGVPRNNIIKAINSDARRLDILKALAKVTQLSKENETEVFIFFAGHGLAADDGKDVFLIPYDGDTGSFLAETAITRCEIFQKVERIGPKSVTVFLDACYTGGTRSQDVTLVASKRPVRVEALNQSVPQGFTILSASASDETSMALEAAEHGMFSYFLMKGMEGDADADNDNQITMAEMRDYVKDKVIRQSNFKQTPKLQGDADRVLVRFQ